jgi:hypothetical protein
MKTLKSKLLITAAAAVIASVGLANAEERGHEGAPAAHGAAPHAQAPQAQAPHAQAPSGQMGSHAQAPSQHMENHAQQAPNREPNRQMGQQAPNRAMGQAEQRGKTDRLDAERNRGERNQPAAQNERGRTNENRAQREEGNRMQHQGTAQGNAQPRGADVRLSSDQRSRIHATVLGERGAPRFARNDLGFDLSVGVRVPRDRIHFVPLPETIVEIEPEWRGYDYFLVGDEVVVVDPDTFEVVAVIPA